MSRPTFVTKLRSFAASAWPRRAAAIAAILAVASCLRLAIGEETPVGSVRGTALIGESGKPLPRARVYLTPQSGEHGDADAEPAGGERYETRTGADGKFGFTRVPAGYYLLSATTRAHAASQVGVVVSEGAATPVTVALARSRPDLAVTIHQRVFTHAEHVKLPVRGYVDTRLAPGADTLRVSLYRTRLSSVLGTAGGDEFLQSREETEQAALPPAIVGSGRTAQLVSSTDMPLKRADREGFYYERLNFGAREPGLYLVDLKHAGASACAWMLVTDTALITKRAGTQTVAFTVDITHGTPIAGSTVRAYSEGKVSAEAASDADGVARMTTPAAADQRRLLFVASRGDDEAVVSSNDYSSEDTGPLRVCTYTDRPVYRPGQRIYYKSVIRKAADPGVRYQMPGSGPITVELRDPQGERVMRETKSPNTYGSISGSVDLSSEAPTGAYSLVLTDAADKHYTHDVYIASYRKPEFNVTVTPARSYYTDGDTAEMTVSAQYYFGAPVAGATVTYNVYSHPDYWNGPEDEGDTPSEDGEDSEESGRYSEGASSEAYGEVVGESTVQLDENGRATLRIPAKLKAGPYMPQVAMLTAHLSIKDDADRQVEAEGSTRVTSGDFHLSVTPEGWAPEPGKPVKLTVQAVGYDGKQVPNLPVELTLGYERWQGGDYHFTATGTRRAVTGPNGSVDVSIVPPRDGQMVVKAKALDSRRREVTADTLLWVTSDQGADLDTEYSDLSLLTDKRRYEPGDTARVLINAARTGQSAYVTIEGDRVYRTFRVPLLRKSTIVRVPVLLDYGPNVSIAACYVRDKHIAMSTATLRVSIAAREIKMTVQPDREARPGQELARYQPGDRVTYRVKAVDNQGRPARCEFSLGVVDESIYALREDDPTAMRDAFYPRRYDAVSTEYSFMIEYLGDADKSEPQIEARKRFPDTAFWQPTAQTDANGEARVTVPLPDNLTTWRATVVGDTADTSVGRGLSKIVSSKDFFVRVELPRFLTQRDQSQVMALVHNETGARQTAIVRIRAEGLDVAGNQDQLITLEPGKVGKATWTVTANSPVSAKVLVTAWTPRVAGTRQYTDGVELTLPSRPHGREKVEGFAGVATGAKPEMEVLRLEPGAISEASRLTVRLTPSVSGSLVGALDYLVGYPYGCTEQTMSRFLPDVLVHRVARYDPSLARSLPPDLPKMVSDGLTRLYRFQHESGGWGWWEHDPDDRWMTAYVLYGLATARSEGFQVSQRVYERAQTAAKAMLVHAPEPDKPYLLYALALSGDRAGATAARAALRVGSMPAESAAYVALADQILRTSAREALDAVAQQAVPEDAALHWRRPAGAGDDRDDVTATAVSLRAILAANRTDPRVYAALRWLMSQRTGEYWYCTRDTSAVLAALCDYLASAPGSATPTGAVIIAVNGRPVQTVQLTGQLLQEPEVTVRVPMASLQTDKNEIRIDRTGGTSPVFYSVELKQTVASEDIGAADSSAVTVTRQYLRVLPPSLGSQSWSVRTEPAGDRAHNGDMLKVQLTIKVARPLSYVLIEDPFPAGCEVTERGEADTTDGEWRYWWASVDIRDDRIAYFARDLAKGTHVISYNLRAQTPGAYHTMPTLVQAMYSPATRAESTETRFTVMP